jgi:hypothetical protein
VGATKWPERGIGGVAEPESPLRDRVESTSGQGPTFARVPALWVFETALAETQTGTVCLKRGQPRKEQHVAIFGVSSAGGGADRRQLVR